MPFDTEIGTSLENIRFEIMSLPVDYSFKTLLLGDINLAIYCYGNREIPGVLEYLSLLAVHIRQYPFHYGHCDLLLADLYALKQILTSDAAPSPPDSANLMKAPGPEHSSTPPESVTAADPAGPDSMEPEVFEPKTVAPQSIETEVIKPEFSELKLIKQDMVEPETVQPENITIPVRPPGPEKTCLRWNFPVSPSKL